MMRSDQTYKKGMFVRVPIDTEQYTDNFRDFRIGKITHYSPASAAVTVTLWNHSPGSPPQKISLDYSIDRVTRCRIIVGTDFLHEKSHQTGTILIACSDTWSNEFCEYFVLLEGKVQRLAESEIIVPSHRQDPDPYTQLVQYEFHSPIWKQARNLFVTAYMQLKTATFGIEDLVSTRVLLLAHQAEVITRVLSDEKCRYILADEVGLGKTIEALVILKGLLKRYGAFKTLIITPSTLMRQWYNELYDKFWLQFVSWKYLTSNFGAEFTQNGMIISTEQLQSDESLWKFLQLQPWGLVIVDEAHHIRKNPDLYDRVYKLSQQSNRALVLSATPIQRLADELFDLLKLMDPNYYGSLSTEIFKQVLSNQRKIRQTVAYHMDSLTPDFFDVDEFTSDMQNLCNLLPQDTVLPNYIEQLIKAPSPLKTAKQAITYLSENYRIENRMIRNRRVNLEEGLLPVRCVTTEYQYQPAQAECDALNELYIYLGHLVAESKTLLEAEFSRLLLNSAFSSPHALLEIVKLRLEGLQQSTIDESANVQYLLRPTIPAKEMERVQLISQRIAEKSGETHLLNNVIYSVERWIEAVEVDLQQIRFNGKQRTHQRVLQLLNVLSDRKTGSKVVIFATWPKSIQFILSALRKLYPQNMIAQFHSLIETSDLLQQEADRFQSDDQCQIMLCDEIGGEGRNFQIADMVIHFDIPWTPAQIEQRIGRVDRLGKQGTVESTVLFAAGEVEEDLFLLWQEAFNLFSKSMSGLEIALEGIQDEILVALQRNPREALTRLLVDMKTRVTDLYKEVEEERYFEQASVNYARRTEFRQIIEEFRSGAILREGCLQWADLAGLKFHYNSQSEIVRFTPRTFNPKSISNAKFFSVPNMQEALQRARRKSNLEIVGTFNRDVGVTREDIVFLAPGDTWTDSIIANALEADRGRCTVALKQTSVIDKEWRGFEFFYSVQVNPRPLFEAGYDPVYLYQAQGFLMVSTYRVIVSVNGDVLRGSNPIYKEIINHPRNEKLLHLGKRGNGAIDEFKSHYPPDIWSNLIKIAHDAVEEILQEEFSFMADEAEDAVTQYENELLGLKANYDWLQGIGITVSKERIETHQQVSQALVEGIRQPLWKLESACFWILQPL